MSCRSSGERAVESIMFEETLLLYDEVEGSDHSTDLYVEMLAINDESEILS